MEKTREETATETRAVCAIVISTTLQNFERLKEAAEKLGCRILYQRAAAPWVRLWIVEKDREAVP